MKCGTEEPTLRPTGAMTSLDVVVAERLQLYKWLNWRSDVTDDAIDAKIRKARSTEKRILDAGLNPKPHGVYSVGIIPDDFTVLHPHVMRKTLADILGVRNSKDWGYVHTDYYGTPENPKFIPHGFSDHDRGKVVFLVEDEDAPGHSPYMPGSLLSGLYWGSDSWYAWEEWAVKYASVTPKPLNYASHGLIWLGDTVEWWSALGSRGNYDYISQPYDVTHELCPYGNADGTGAWWDMRSAFVGSLYAVAPVVW